MRLSAVKILNVFLLTVLVLSFLIFLKNDSSELKYEKLTALRAQLQIATSVKSAKPRSIAPLHRKWDPFGLFTHEDAKSEQNENVVFGASKDSWVVPAKRNCTPVTNFAFVKTHKAGSTTMISIFQRFGWSHDLTFALPARGDVFMGWPYRLDIEKHVLQNEDGSHQANLLVNHAIFNKTVFKTLLPNDPRFVGIVRYPLTHFKSAMNYFKKMLIPAEEEGKYTMMERIIRFAENPDYYDGINDRMKNSPDPKFHVRSVTKNFQSADFGLARGDMDDETKVAGFLDQIKKDFPLVLVMEYMHESLLMLKRKWCWGLSDIFFLQKNVFKYDGKTEKIPEDTAAKILDWNNVDLQLYNQANTTLWKLIDGEPGFSLELSYYKSVNNLVGSYCRTNIILAKTLGVEAVSKAKTGPLEIAASPWNEPLTFTQEDCKDLMRFEMAFTRKLQIKQRPDLFDESYYLQINDGIRKWSPAKPPIGPKISHKVPAKVKKPEPTEDSFNSEDIEETTTEKHLSRGKRKRH